MGWSLEYRILTVNQGDIPTVSYRFAFVTICCFPSSLYQPSCWLYPWCSLVWIDVPMFRMFKSPSWYRFLMIRIRTVSKHLMNYCGQRLTVCFCIRFVLWFCVIPLLARPLSGHSLYRHHLIDKGLLPRIALLTSSTADPNIKVYFCLSFSLIYIYLRI